MKKIVGIICVMMFVCFLAGNASAETSATANAGASAQGGGAIVDNSAQGGGATVDNSDHSTNTVRNYEVVVPGNIPIPGTNGFFTSPTPDSSFRSAKELLRFGDKFTEGALESIASNGNVDMNYDYMNGLVKVSDEELANRRWIKIILDDGKVEGFSARAIVDAEADDADTNSLQVIAKLALKALRDGCNALVLTAEGAHRVVEADGWGVGFYTVGGAVGNDGLRSVNGGGGTGYAHNATATEDRPWVQGYAGVVGLKEGGIVVVE